MNLSMSRCFHCVKCLMRRSVRLKETRHKLNSVSGCKYGTEASKREAEWREPSGRRTGIYLYNSLTKRKDELILPKGNTLSWYACGPTVYDSSHIGHASNYVRFDVIRRILTNFFNINVIYMMGITDIDDKIIDKANLLDKEFTAITTYYEREFFQEMSMLNILPPTITSRVTNYVADIVSFIKTIVDKGHGYVAEDGSVYFDIAKFGNYNKLSPPTLSQGSPGVKRNIGDFALWKAVKPGEPFWSSPWGPGRPGWHIECSTMASCLFGSNLDIHSGGIDLIFPHHENELAQSCSYHDTHQWANYWLHTGFLHLQFDPEKMSKSLKNIIPTSKLIQKYTSNQFRMYCLLTHYRNNIEFAEEKMNRAIQLDNKIGHFLHICNGYIKGQADGGNIPEAEIMKKLAETEEKVINCLRDDFNTAEALGAMFDLISAMNVGFTQTDAVCRSPGVVAAVQLYVKRVCSKLGFRKKGLKVGQSQSQDNSKLKEVLEKTVNFRYNIREFALKSSIPGTESLPKKEKKKVQNEFFAPLLDSCDELRTQLSSCNISIDDHKGYSSWEFVNANTRPTKMKKEETLKKSQPVSTEQKELNNVASKDTVSDNLDNGGEMSNDKSAISDQITENESDQKGKKS